MSVPAATPRDTSTALNRFGLGARPNDAMPADARRWLLDQFARYQPMPAAWAPLPRTTTHVDTLVAMQRAARQAGDGEKAAARQAYRREMRDEYLTAVAARMQSALQSDTPFVERLVHFWSNHFAVSVDKLTVIGLAGAFEAEAIRPHVLGRFEDMLFAAARHPAMLLYLDQAQSIGPESRAGSAAAARNPQRRRGLNENLAREIMELHTLGVRSGYTQDDVTEFARALTGWSIAGDFGLPARLAAGDAGDPRYPGFQFRSALHEPGPRTLLGRSYSQGGEAQGRAMLVDLARAPATAEHLATKLARHFASDEPPPALVRRLAEAFTRTNGDLPSVYRTLVESPECWAGATVKFKSPWDWSVSSLRALGREEVPAMQVAGLLQQLGQPVWRPGSPAGWDDIAASWAAPDALLRRVEAAQRMAGAAARTG
ncbi:MAG TPA: DUF1800 domain-containing protein, partial [Ramlibacter sp.]|uniref:DUF1800 domain-containing protein n=1 Tax=Ramlibacter sp. TaxID=1917967 RepID=UPI002BB0A449